MRAEIPQQPYLHGNEQGRAKQRGRRRRRVFLPILSAFRFGFGRPYRHANANTDVVSNALWDLVFRVVSRTPSPEKDLAFLSA